MFARSLRNAAFLSIAAVMAFIFLSGCTRQETEGGNAPAFVSFRDIPGVTEKEIESVEKLRGSVKAFNFSSVYGTELFFNGEGGTEGFTARLCEWLTELFGIPFEPNVIEWDELIPGLEDGSIDFTGDLTANKERLGKYYMTEDITQRQIIKIHIYDDRTLSAISETRPLRYAFLEGATTAGIIRKSMLDDFETVFVSDYAQAYGMFESGEIDAFFGESPTEAAFDEYGDMEVSIYFPTVYSPVSLATQNPEYEAIIEIVQKALENGARSHIKDLYQQGRQDYLRHKLSLHLTEEEREYIRNNPVVNYAAEISNYPVSFYDNRTKQWEGIAHDVLRETERLTGLTFERANDENDNWPVLLEMLGNGQAKMITELIPSEERMGDYLWSGEEFFRDYFALISKTEFRDVNINDILYVRVGAAKGTAHTTLFRRWFPDHRDIREYESTYDAFNALEQDEIDMVITSEHQLLILTNFRELIGYKTNFVFDFYFDSTFGFNKEEAVLCSIVTKAMKLIDVETISGRWLRRTYDYRVRLAQERAPFLLGVGMLSVAFIFAVVLFIKKRGEGRRLESIIEMRTKESTENQSQLKEILQQNEYQLMKLNLMIQASKIVLWDMEVNADDPLNPKNEFFWTEEFRAALGFTDNKDFPDRLGSWIDRLHPEDRTRTLDAFKRHLADKTGATHYDLEYRLQRKDGEYAYFRATGEAMRDENGKALRIVGAMADINETKRLVSDLETESTMLHTMFDSVPDLIFCKDTGFNYFRCNESLLKYFNLTEEELFGKDDEDGLGIARELAQEYRAMDRQVMKERKVITYEEYVPALDGSMKLFETNKVPLILNGSIAGIMGIARDITERKAMEEAAQSANKAKTAFLANMSHEIRTPMNAILGMSEILENENLGERQMGFVRDISQSAHSLLSIINDILDMSKIEAGKLELHPVDYSFSQFMDNIVSMFTHVAGNKGLEFIYETSGDIPDYLFGDDIRLRQVLTNICGNAVKFTDTGHVKLSVSASRDKLVYKIEDTGSGIFKDDLPKLFNAFEQVDKYKNRKVLGTGLGLPICKSFIDMMDGEINVESEYGYGSAFTITLPIVRGRAESVGKDEMDGEEQAIFAPDARILITDDNAFNLKVASGLLNLMDITAETADSGDRAIEMIKTTDYDIVFMDHMMPMKDGIETLRDIRALGKKYRELTVIALTANAVKGAREMFLKSGFDDFIAKPINTGELRDIIKKHLPHDKIRTETNPEGRIARLSMEDELMRKASITFVKENRETLNELSESLGAGDVKTANRIAHTLKSGAGYLGRKELMDAAFSLERSLQNDIDEHTPEQIRLIERELNEVLHDLEPLVAEAELNRPEAVEVDRSEVVELLALIKPLLIKGDFDAVDYVERLQGIAGLEELADLIDDYDFEGALGLLESLQ